MSDVVDRPMRADARRNHERVLAAAEAVFSKAGLKAQVEDVARRAGVGVRLGAGALFTVSNLDNASDVFKLWRRLGSAGGAAMKEGGPKG